MSSFTDAVAKVLEHEGGLSDHPADPGGITKYGISLRFLTSLGFPYGDLDQDGDIDADDIRGLTKVQAIEIYKKQWWDRYQYWRLPDQVDWKTFDLAVNMGAKQAHKLLQRACMSCEQYLAVDGIIGPNTLRAVNVVPWHCLFAALRSEAGGFYRSLVAIRPELKGFLRGWLNRAYS